MIVSKHRHVRSPLPHANHRVLTTAKTPAERLAKFKEDPKAYLEYRRAIEADLHAASEVMYKGTDQAIQFQKMCEDHMRTKLAKKPEIFKALVPDYPVGCRRLTPGPGVSNLHCKLLHVICR